jgi:hypothetical protein
MSKQPYPPNPFSVANYAERLMKNNDKLSLVFAVVGAIYLGAVTLRSVKDLCLPDKHDSRSR